MKIGIVGLPNVGKSTLFNAFLKRQQALSANYPFATIEPNVGVVDVYDERVDKLAELSKSEKRVYANITFVDIAGIVKDAHKGEGLGNQFLSNIREVDLIMVLLRDFADENIIRRDSTNPDSDFEIIKTELILKDLESIKSQESKIKKANLSKEDEHFKNAVLKIKEKLDNGEIAKEASLTEEEQKEADKFHLLTAKPFIKVLNVAESEVAKRYTASGNGSETNNESRKGENLVVSAKIESEIATLNDEDQKIFLSEYGLTESPLNAVIKSCYEILGLRTFLTTGPKESRAWKFKEGMTAKESSGVIHTDFVENFIKAEVINYADFIKYGSKSACRDAGKLRLEGKDYLMKDGDVVEFKIGA